jgi:hypothetical protein
MSRRERGQVAPLLAVVIVAAGFLCVVVAKFGVAAAERASARTAADAAALAGAAAGRSGADALAAANRGSVVRYEQSGRDVRLRVAVDGAAASAKARQEGAGRPDVAPAMRAALGRAEQLVGRTIPVTRVRSGGLAVEVSPDVAAQLRSVAPDAGLCQPAPEREPYLFEVCPPPRGGSQ